MGLDAVITGIVILGAIVLFITEKLSIDIIGLLIIAALVSTGVITPQEGIAGFGNSATLTVAFMFVLSAAILKTGSLQYITGLLTKIFRNHYQRGLILLTLTVSAVSAFINNTPVVAVMIPVTTQIAKNANRAASKLLIPISYASIFGGTCTLIGTSTNILVNGIAEQNGLPSFSMFSFAPVGLVFVVVGSLFMIFIGQRLLPTRKSNTEQELESSNIDYLAEIEILKESGIDGISILSSPLVKELEIEIIELRRNGTTLSLPQGDTILKTGDLLKVRCNVEKIRQAKDQFKVNVKPVSQDEYDDDQSGTTSFVELVIPTNSELEGKTLRQFDFRRRFRAAPIAIRQREEVLKDQLQEVKLRSGDVILCEMKTHFLSQHRSAEKDENTPFIILSEQGILSFNRKEFFKVLVVLLFVVLSASTSAIPIVVSTLIGIIALILGNVLTMKEVYSAIQWPIVFLLAGALSLGSAMNHSGLAHGIAEIAVNNLAGYGPVAILAAIYLLTSLMTELMSNNATAAIMAPLSIAIAFQLDLSPTPFLVATMFAASLSFMTPIGYQTNTMIYGAGGYRFRDFLRVGVWLNLLFWVISIILIPIVFPF